MREIGTNPSTGCFNSIVLQVLLILLIFLDISINRTQLQDKQERIDELHRLHAQVQINFEHYRESAREQRLIEQQQYEQQKQELQVENKTSCWVMRSGYWYRKSRG